MTYQHIYKSLTDLKLDLVTPGESPQLEAVMRNKIYTNYVRTSATSAAGGQHVWI